jgi:hypothetical protein
MQKQQITEFEQGLTFNDFILQRLDMSKWGINRNFYKQTLHALLYLPKNIASNPEHTLIVCNLDEFYSFKNFEYVSTECHDYSYAMQYFKHDYGQ